MKSLAMSLPHDGSMCAVPLAPGVVQTGGAETERMKDHPPPRRVEISISGLRWLVQ